MKYYFSLSMTMIKYVSASGKQSGVSTFDIGDTFIIIEFQESRKYKYTISLNDQETIEEMKLLAQSGEGLSTFISRNRDWLRFERLS